MLTLFHAYGVALVVAGIAALYIALAIGIALFGIETNQVSLEALAPEAGAPDAVPQGQAITP
ncbi:MAG: hypothetical protein WDN49_02445 [Acetobacteraceae bacterium]